MSYTKTEEKNLNLNENENHRSDGSELIPAEVQASARREENPLSDAPGAEGYTVDEEGLINNYAIEPDISTAQYPSVWQQRQYLFWGACASLFVFVILGIAIAVS